MKGSCQKIISIPREKGKSSGASGLGEGNHMKNNFVRYPLPGPSGHPLPLGESFSFHPKDFANDAMAGMRLPKLADMEPVCAKRHLAYMQI
jgi:hypothetical protein